MDVTYDILVLLFFVAGLAGFIDAMAGGGGLLTLPALLSAGVPPTQHWRPINCKARLVAFRPLGISFATALLISKICAWRLPVPLSALR